ncbi:MAG: CRISPR-associated helicase Cas3' [Candidatus Contendobacter sp.]|nr:CRISPR-associated helicase Cas3' [Candidatus Contendobacter sp.]
MASTQDRFFRYWGKTHGEDYHLLPYHALDVAAVGCEYLAQHARLRGFFARTLGVAEEELPRWIGFFLVLHDVGKFAEPFQSQQPALLQQLQGRQGRSSYATRHDTLGYWAWMEWLAPLICREDWLGLGTNARSYRRFISWVRAVTGHHGQPPEENAQSQLELLKAFPEPDRQALLEFAGAAHALFRGESTRPVTPAPQEEALKRTSWWVAGLTVLADWLGSNQNYFTFHRDPMPLADYWQRARAMARRALRVSGVLPPESASPQLFSVLFPNLAHCQPTPLQQLADDLPLVAGPQLFVLEDLTGAGKTEAALDLAHRVLAAQSGDGLYFALPTMATANAMYRRVASIYPRLFSADTPPSLVLAHSARDLMDPFRRSVPTTVEDDYPRDGQDAAPASARCAAWLADNRKKALLAPVGVGTIDQALLAILPARHQCLRLAGLFGKVLLVDEVHANDAYMHRLLCALLEFHAAAGGGVILLSATLPRKMRQELADAFQRGSGGERVKLTEPSYPLLTHITTDGGREYPIAAQPTRRRRVEVIRLDNGEELLVAVVKAAQAGHCVCWVRNTVADAREAYRALAERWPPAKLDLFHARFAMGDRLAMEERVLQQFGPDSKAQDRQGRILVATQVVEQSLDLDFDLLVSDLAPLDLLIQRAGRLCRHPRDREGNRANAEQRDRPRLWLYGPPPDDEVPANWYSALFPRAAFVYPNPAQLWRTARLLEERGGFTLPDEARELIEEVFGAVALPAPTALDDADLKAWGEDRSKVAQAQNLSLALDIGYSREGFAWWDDNVTPTRLGEAETTLVLMRWNGRDLAPWCDGPHPWALSQVKMRQALAAEPATVADSTLAEALDAWRETQPGGSRWLLPVPLTEIQPGVWHGEVRTGKGESLGLRYDRRLGLRRASEDGAVDP